MNKQSFLGFNSNGEYCFYTVEMFGRLIDHWVEDCKYTDEMHNNLEDAVDLALKLKEKDEDEMRLYSHAFLEHMMDVIEFGISEISYEMSRTFYFVDKTSFYPVNKDKPDDFAYEFKKKLTGNFNFIPVWVDDFCFEFRKALRKEDLEAMKQEIHKILMVCMKRAGFYVIENLLERYILIPRGPISPL